MAYPFQAAVPVAKLVGDPRGFPVRRIFCVGRNYREHAREMGADPDEPPFFFSKPADALVGSGESVAYPPLTKDFQFEGELVVAIGKEGAEICTEDALNHIFGYAIGNDLTRRDLQLDARARGRPWDWGKGFDRSAVCSAIYRTEDVGHIARGALETRVNGIIKQSEDISDMIWKVENIIAFLSQSVRIKPGDLIYTGTPAGVGALVPGDECKVSISQLGTLMTLITEPEQI